MQTELSASVVAERLREVLNGCENIFVSGCGPAADREILRLAAERAGTEPHDGARLLVLAPEGDQAREAALVFGSCLEGTDLTLSLLLDERSAKLDACDVAVGTLQAFNRQLARGGLKVDHRVLVVLLNSEMFFEGKTSIGFKEFIHLLPKSFRVWATAARYQANIEWNLHASVKTELGILIGEKIGAPEVEEYFLATTPRRRMQLVREILKDASLKRIFIRTSNGTETQRLVARIRQDIEPAEAFRSQLRRSPEEVSRLTALFHSPDAPRILVGTYEAVQHLSDWSFDAVVHWVFPAKLSLYGEYLSVASRPPEDASRPIRVYSFLNDTDLRVFEEMAAFMEPVLKRRWRVSNPLGLEIDLPNERIETSSLRFGAVAAEAPPLEKTVEPSRPLEEVGVWHSSYDWRSTGIPLSETNQGTDVRFVHGKARPVKEAEAWVGADFGALTDSSGAKQEDGRFDVGSDASFDFLDAASDSEIPAYEVDGAPWLESRLPAEFQTAQLESGEEESPLSAQVHSEARDSEDERTAEAASEEAAPKRRTLTIRAGYIPRTAEPGNLPVTTITEPLSSSTLERRAALERERRTMASDLPLTHQTIGKRRRSSKNARKGAPRVEEGMLSLRPGKKTKSAQGKPQKAAKRGGKRSAKAKRVEQPLDPMLSAASADVLTAPQVVEAEAIRPAELKKSRHAMTGYLRRGRNQPKKASASAVESAAKVMGEGEKSLTESPAAENALNHAASAPAEKKPNEKRRRKKTRRHVDGATKRPQANRQGEIDEDNFGNSIHYRPKHSHSRQPDPLMTSAGLWSGQSAYSGTQTLSLPQSMPASNNEYGFATVYGASAPPGFVKPNGRKPSGKSAKNRSKSGRGGRARSRGAGGKKPTGAEGAG